MDTNPYSTATMTKTVSSTKLAVATLAMFVAGGAAFAVSPLNTAGEKFSCQDSDGGHQIHEFGTAKQINRRTGAMKKENSDFCTVPSGKKPSKLTEFTCVEGGLIAKQKVACPSGTQCVDGECLGESATSTSGLPDLVIKDVRFKISEDLEDPGIEVFVTISNSGNSASTPTRVFVMPSPTASRTANIGIILPGQTQVVSTVVGDLVTSVNVSVDGEGNVEESNEGNNELNNVPVVLSGSSTSTTTNGLPDLIITNLIFDGHQNNPGYAYYNGVINARCVIQNVGTADAVMRAGRPPFSFRIKMEFLNNNRLYTQFLRTESSVSMPDVLSPGESYITSCAFPNREPSSAARLQKYPEMPTDEVWNPVTISIQIDSEEFFPGGHVIESNEDNNVYIVNVADYKCRDPLPFMTECL